MTTQEHGKVVLCKCGETFESDDALERHRVREEIHRFNDAVQAWIESHFGEPFASYHDAMRNDIHAVAGYGVAKAEDVPTDPESSMYVQYAALAFCESALVAPNVEMLLEHVEEPDRETATIRLHRELGGFAFVSFDTPYPENTERVESAVFGQEWADEWLGPSPSEASRMDDDEIRAAGKLPVEEDLANAGIGRRYTVGTVEIVDGEADMDSIELHEPEWPGEKWTRE